MIIDISDSNFKRIFKDEDFYLPIRWTGNNFVEYLDRLLNKYRTKIEKETVHSASDYKEIKELELISRICNLLLKSIDNYLSGFPSKAYETFSDLMRCLMKQPLRIYYKSTHGSSVGYTDKLNLFRASCVKDNIRYDRKRLFHTPYNLRSKVATCRYSIAGFPSLYLGTNLELCCEEIKYNPHSEFGIASRFQTERNILYNDTEIKVIELAVKPQDFLPQENRSNERIGRKFDELDLNSKEIKSAYLLWYPVIAACSFIRVNKQDPFAVEYIVPQLLMQWVREEMEDIQEEAYDQLIGVRYFSCASERASDLGFNYVFPASGKQHSEQFPFCPILMGAFRMTKPYFINEFEYINTCEFLMIKDNDLKHINDD